MSEEKNLIVCPSCGAQIDNEGKAIFKASQKIADMNEFKSNIDTQIEKLQKENESYGEKIKELEREIRESKTDRSFGSRDDTW